MALRYSILKSVPAYQIRSELIATGYISDYAAGKAADYITDHYDVYTTYKFDKPKWYWRLSFPGYMILWILFALTSPIKWVLTGDWYWDFHKGPMKFYRAWRDKLGF